MKKINLNEQITKHLRNVLNEMSDASIKRRYINLLYKTVEKSGLTSHLFNDDYWLGKTEVCNLIGSMEGITDFEVTVNNGGYRQNDSGDAFWKEYNLMIEFNGTIVINGLLKCHAAGSVEDPFSRYDITVTFW